MGGGIAQQNVFRYLYWGGDTSHNITYYSESGGDTTHENVFRCSNWGGDTAQNSKTWGGGTPHKIKVGCWLSGWLAGWLACSMIIVPMPILAPSCKLKLARFSAKLRIQDEAKCGNILKVYAERTRRKLREG